MFGFEKNFKKKSAGISELPVVIDMELLDKALNMAVAVYLDAHKTTCVNMRLPADERREILRLEKDRIDLFIVGVKRFINELSEKE